jgi:hypothetical protein
MMILIGFGISVIVIYTDGNKYSNDSCPEFPKLTISSNNSASFILEKDYFYDWHWRYSNIISNNEVKI